MNILYHFRTRGTGPEAVHISGIATAFEKLGHHVVFSSPTGIDPRKSAGASPYQSQENARTLASLSRFCPGLVFELLEIGYNIPAFFRNRKLLCRGKIGLIYERHALFLASTAWLARLRHVPLIVEVNELVGDARVRKQPWLSFIARWFDKFVFRRAKGIIVVSPYLKRRIQALGINESKILVLPNAVDDEAYAQPADGSVMRKRLGLEGKVVVGFVGWFVAWHRLDLLLEVFASLAASRPDLRLLLVGEGPLRAELERQIKSFGMDGKVVFSGGLPHVKIPAVIAAMDICVVPHSNEYRSPIKLFEYMGQSRLVVAPDTEPVEMVVRDGENGLLFSAGDKDSFTRALLRGVDDHSLREQAGKQARCDVLQHYTWRQNAECVLNAFDLGNGNHPEGV